MSAVLIPATIKQLPAQLANQIAAGEVIERPASVVKELLENALDADCTRIDIELVNGGMSGIRVTDNGSGINSLELPLAVSRHATSKIDSVSDLLALQSLGFRGEALASICSVSQWEIISRQQQQDEAAVLSWQHPEQVMKINHAVGTCATINNLFHNTPARRKFLRAERTEYRHCEEVIKRLALTRFDVGFYLKHNAKQVLRLPAMHDDIGRSRRVAQICAQKFISQALAIDYPRNDMRLWGWISPAGFSRQSTDLQYFYINGRIIRDRLINHAIRIAYQDVLPPGRNAVYVLHLELDPATVDVNVHPTKHEVRFQESRLIHDFISRNVRDAIGQVGEDVNATYIKSDYATVETNEPLMPGPTRYSASAIEAGETAFGQVVSVAHERFAITLHEACFYLIDLQHASAIWVAQNWFDSYHANDVKSQPLLIPQRLGLTDAQSLCLEQYSDAVSALGVQMTAEQNNQYLIRKIPNLCSGYECVDLCRHLLNISFTDDAWQDQLCAVLLNTRQDIAKLNVTGLLRAMSEHKDNYADCWRELTEASLLNWLSFSDD